MPSHISRAAYGLLGLLCLLACAAGCSSTQYADEADEVVEAPDDGEQDATVEGLGAQAWCSDFGHAGLDEMVERAWSENMQLKAAWARLRQAEAVADIESSALWPTAEAGADVDVSNREFGGFDGVDGPVDGGTQTEASWELSATAAYEVDLWGRNRHRASAARLEADAFEADARSLAITLTSEVAEAWFDVIAQRERVELLEAQLEASRDIAEITRIRARRGLVGALDVAQQDRNVESIQGELAAAKGLERTSRHRLAVLVGQAPGDARDDQLVGDETLPDVEPLDDPGVPADLLQRRPDVRSAYLFLEAADERTAAAVADRLPRLRLTASLGFQAEQLTNLFEQLFWSVGAGLSQSLFEGGQLRAEVERSEAIAQEQLYFYADALLVAMREVRDALALESTGSERIESLERELDIAESVLELARKRYRTGTVDYLRVLTGLQALQEVERTLLEARRQQISHRIALCRALGGSWVDSVEPSIATED